MHHQRNDCSLLEFEVTLHQRAGRWLCDCLMGFVLFSAQKW